jgi:hypothetical protein
MNYLKIILYSFCKSNGMEINMNKSCILFNDLSDNLKRYIAHIFPMNMEPLDNGLKYLGFILKPNNYTKGD